MDITGFDEQIGASFTKGIKKMAKKTASRQQVVAVKPAVAIKRMQAVAVKPSVMIKKQQAVAVKPSVMMNRQQVVAVKPSVMMNRQQVVAVKPSVMPKKRVIVKPTPIFSTDKIKSVPKTSVVTTQRVLPSIKSLSPQNKIQVVKSVPLPQRSSIQRSFAKVDLPYQTVVKSNPIVKLKNAPISYSTSSDMIQPAVDSGVSNYYGR